jgi:hypothetical protein
VIGAESPILAFVRCKDCITGRFTVDGDGIAGLVTLSDLQKLPARAALFGLVTNLELVMIDAIEALFPNDIWIERLNPDDRREFEENIKRAKDRDTFTRAIDYTQLRWKYFILRRKCELGEWKIFQPINDLRNGLAHAKPYIVDRRDELRLVETVRLIDELVERIAAASTKSKG